MQRGTTSDLALVVLWPTTAGPIEGLLRRRKFPLAREPRHLDPSSGLVWVARDGQLVARFRTRGISRPKQVRLLDGKVSPQGRELEIEPGSAEILARPVRLDSIPVDEGSGRGFGHAHGFRYVTVRKRRFVRITDKPAPQTPTDVPIEMLTAQSWVQQSRDQASHTHEGVKYPTEAELVIAFDEALRAARGSGALTRHRITLADGTEIYSDAYDAQNELLIEAKSTTDRPAVRMAVGQLLDYGRHLKRGTKLAILLPRMPSDDLIDFVTSNNIQVIWRQPDGTFHDTTGGALVR